MTLEKQIVDYWDRAPCGAWHSTNPTESLEYSTAVLEHRIKTVDQTGVQSAFVNWSEWHNKKVLEFGCGIGTDGIRFCQAGAQYTGIDISEKSIEIAKQRFAAHGLDAELLVGDGTSVDLPIALNSFDLVYVWGVIHHWPNPEKFISAIKKYIKPNGCFIFMVYAENSWQHILSKHNLGRFEAQAGCPWIEFYNHQKIQNLMADDFDIADIKRYGIFPYNVEKYKKRILELEPWFSVMPEALMSALNAELGTAFVVKSYATFDR